MLFRGEAVEERRAFIESWKEKDTISSSPCVTFISHVRICSFVSRHVFRRKNRSPVMQTCKLQSPTPDNTVAEVLRVSVRSSWIADMHGLHPFGLLWTGAFLFSLKARFST